MDTLAPPNFVQLIFGILSTRPTVMRRADGISKLKISDFHYSPLFIIDLPTTQTRWLPQTSRGPSPIQPLCILLLTQRRKRYFPRTVVSIQPTLTTWLRYVVPTSSRTLVSTRFTHKTCQQLTSYKVPLA